MSQNTFVLVCEKLSPKNEIDADDPIYHYKIVESCDSYWVSLPDNSPECTPEGRHVWRNLLYNIHMLPYIKYDYKSFLDLYNTIKIPNTILYYYERFEKKLENKYFTSRTSDDPNTFYDCREEDLFDYYSEYRRANFEDLYEMIDEEDDRLSLAVNKEYITKSNIIYLSDMELYKAASTTGKLCFISWYNIIKVGRPRYDIYNENNMNMLINSLETLFSDYDTTFTKGIIEVNKLIITVQLKEL